MIEKIYNWWKIFNGLDILCLKTKQNIWISQMRVVWRDKRSSSILTSCCLWLWNNKHYCPDVWQFVCWSQGGQQERHTRKESSECPNDVPTHCETQKNTVKAKTAPTHLYGEIQIQIQQRQIWGKSKSMIIATQVSHVSTTLLSRTATPTKRPARAPQKWPIYLAHYIKAKLLFKRLFASPTVQLT